MLSPVADLVARSCLRMSCQRGHTEATSVAYNIYIGIDTCLAEPLARMLRLKHVTQDFSQDWSIGGRENCHTTEAEHGTPDANDDANDDGVDPACFGFVFRHCRFS